MGHVSIPTNFIRGIHDHHAVLLRQNAGSFTQHGSLAYARFTQDQNALT